VLDRHAEVAPRVLAVLRRALARDPDARFRTAQDFADALRAIAQSARIPLSDTELVPWMSSLGILPSQSGFREASRGGLADLSFRPREAARPAAAPSERPRAAHMPPVTAPEYHVLARHLLGPLGLAKVLELIATGRIDQTALVSEDGVLFQPLSEIEELARICQRRAFSFSQPPEAASWHHPVERAAAGAADVDPAPRMFAQSPTVTVKSGSSSPTAPPCSSPPPSSRLAGARLVSAGLVSGRRRRARAVRRSRPAPSG
jgi:hypothetical protein